MKSLPKADDTDPYPRLSGPSNVDPVLLRRPAIKCLTFYATISPTTVGAASDCFSKGFKGAERQRFTQSERNVLVCGKRRDLLVNSWFSHIRVLLMNYVSDRPTLPLRSQKLLEITAEWFWTIFTTLLSSVMQAKHLFFFFFTSSFFSPYWHNTFVQTSFKNINKL